MLYQWYLRWRGFLCGKYFATSPQFRIASKPFWLVNWTRSSFSSFVKSQRNMWGSSERSHFPFTCGFDLWTICEAILWNIKLLMDSSSVSKTFRARQRVIFSSSVQSLTERNGFTIKLVCATERICLALLFGNILLASSADAKLSMAKWGPLSTNVWNSNDPSDSLQSWFFLSGFNLLWYCWKHCHGVLLFSFEAIFQRGNDDDECKLTRICV